MDITKENLIQFELGLVEDWKAGKVRVPMHLSGGNEDWLINIFHKIKPEDWVVSTHRNHYHYLLKGGDADALRREILGEGGALCGGRSGSMHTTDIPRRFISSCLVGCGAPVAVGLALGIQLARGNNHVWCFVGDGAVDQGMFYEAVCFSEGKGLPVTFVIEDNDRSVESSKVERGMWPSSTRLAIETSARVIHIPFRPTYPHVADGTFVSF